MKRLFYLFFLSSLYMNLHAQDLVVTDLRLPSSQLSPGSSAYVTARIANQGDNYADYSYVGFYLSSDTVLTLADKFLGASSFTSLYPGGIDSASTSISIPNDISLGNYYLFAFADYTGLVFESKENNNSKFVPVSLANPYIDLSIPFFTVYSQDLLPGSYVSATTQELNSGTGTSSWNYIGYYLSKDTVVDFNDYSISTSYIGSLSGGTSGWDYPSFYLPTSIDTGSYYVIAKADDGNYNSEADEDNNVAYAKIKIALPKTDIENSSLYLGNTSIVPGTYVYPIDSIRNSGNTLVSNVSVSYYLSEDSVLNIGDTFLSSEYLGYIYPGNFATSVPSLYLPSNVPTGQYFLLSVVDESNSVIEDNEYNNMKALRIKVSEPTVDLVIPSIYLNSKVSPGAYVSPQIYEFNQGNAYAGQNQVSYYLSADTTLEIGDTYLGSDYVWSVAPQGYAYLSPYLYIPGSVPYGNYYLLAAADNSFVINESNEDNNIGRVAIAVEPASIDLTVSYADSTPLTVSPYTYVSPVITESNLGTSYADYHYLGFYLSTDSILDSTDQQINSYYVSGLSGNSSVSNSYGFQFPIVSEGNYYLIAATDYPSLITESDERNNNAWLKVKVQPSNIDLTIQSLSIDSSNIYAGSVIYSSLIESNIGSEDASGHYVGYFLSTDTIYDGGADIFLTTNYVYGVPADSSSYSQLGITIPTGLSEGTYYVLAYSDFYGNVTESSENNNIAYAPLYIKSSSSDLYVYKFDAGVSSVSAGYYLYPSLYDWNGGTQDAGSHYVAYYLSSDSIVDGSDNLLSYDYVSSVYANSYVYLNPTLYIPSSLSSGNYYLIAVTDAFGYVNESNEKNNYSVVPLAVVSNGVDLTVSNLSSPNTDVTAGSFVYVNVEEDNKGNISANSHHIGFYLSKDTTYDDYDVYLDANFVSGISAGSSFIWHPALLVPGNTPDGFYYIIAVGDYGNSVVETNEYNNNKALRIKVGNPAVGADVYISAIWGLEGSLSTGKSYPVSYLEVNKGTEWAGEHYNTFYLSTDTTHDAGDILVGSSYVYGGINAGGSFFDSTVYVQFHSGIAPGNYYLIAWADASLYVSESNEENNTTALPIQIGGPIITGLNNDLYSSSVSLYPNPSNGIIHFTTLKDVEKVEISDMQGHTVAKMDAASLEGTQVDLGYLGSGMYMVKTMKEGAVTSTHKLIITK